MKKIQRKEKDREKVIKKTKKKSPSLIMFEKVAC